MASFRRWQLLAPAFFLSLGLLYAWSIFSHISIQTSRPLPSAGQSHIKNHHKILAPLQRSPSHLHRRGPRSDFSQSTGLSVGAMKKVHLPPNAGNVFEDQWKSRKFLVELSAPAVEFGGSVETIKKQQEVFIKYIQGQNNTGEVTHQFSRTLNLIEVTVNNPTDLIVIRSAPGVVYVWEPFPVSEIVPASVQVKPDSSISSIMVDGITGVKYDIGNQSFTGKGVKIGIIDSGIDYTHPAFGGKMGAGMRVTHGYNFLNNSTDPMDNCHGHGTHVAGLISSNDPNVTAVAPGATLGIYRVVDCDRSIPVTTGNLIAAMEMAADDGMDIINLSIGGTTGWSEHPLARKTSWLVNVRNITVVASAGNDGVEGMWQTSVMSLGKGVISACSFDAGSYISNYFTVLDDSYEYNFMLWGMDYSMDQLPSLIDGREIHVLYQNSNIDYYYGCQYPPEAKGKFVVVIETRCSVREKAQAAEAAGVAGILLASTLAGMPAMSASDLTDTTVLPVPVLGISTRSGSRLLKRFQDGKSTLMTFRKEAKEYKYQGGTAPSYFSSWGLDPELFVKPSVCGPGRYVYSTYPLALSSYATISGTSQAAPFITGAMALVLERSRSLKRPMSIEHQHAMIQNYGMPKNASFHYMEGKYFPLASVVKQGSGILRVAKVTEGQAVVVPSSFSFNDTVHARHLGEWEFGEDLEIFSYSDTPLRYSLDHVPAQTLSAKMNSLTSSPEPTNYFAEVITNTTQVIVPPWGSVKVRVLGKRPSFLANNGTWLYSGYVRFRPMDMDPATSKSHTLNIPYSGYVGDLSSMDQMDPSTEVLPAIFQYQEAQIVLFNKTSLASRSFTFGPEEDPVGIGFRLVFPAKLVMVEILGEGRTVNHGWIPQGYQRWLSRNNNGTSSAMHVLQWSGTKMSTTEADSIGSDDPAIANRFEGLDTIQGNDANANITQGKDMVLMNSRNEELVPDGVYELKLSVLRPFRKMDTLNPDDFHIWYSPPIRVARGTNSVRLEPQDPPGNQTKNTLDTMGQDLEMNHSSTKIALSFNKAVVQNISSEIHLNEQNVTKEVPPVGNERQNESVLILSDDDETGKEALEETTVGAVMRGGEVSSAPTSPP
ncbi:hypothetical protein BJ684DRAFT_19970 [Piptocephalis cylindrospora]|uniref:Peptidase S8/S53 domain-containing protein n=1 Tax=Piptocephalis cylindrospora TaxID=1907219 RepID=A0A4P9Y3Z7_9FUNG|nr:hypothetical protein BJ684DRAFT_19970 [Piptocephalis cylindrospora]|eukprot:RKP13553.1 hypothetical protein BJ684DRAFT_19970 [Piptocephalis cylindrospora]